MPVSFVYRVQLTIYRHILLQRWKAIATEDGLPFNGSVPPDYKIHANVVSDLYTQLHLWSQLGQSLSALEKLGLQGGTDIARKQLRQNKEMWSLYLQMLLLANAGQRFAQSRLADAYAAGPGKELVKWKLSTREAIQR